MSLGVFFAAANPVQIAKADGATDAGHRITRAILAETDFVAFFPSDEMFVEEMAGLLRCIPVKTNVPTRQIGILRRRAETLSPFAQQLIAEIKAACRDDGYVAEAIGGDQPSAAKETARSLL